MNPTAKDRILQFIDYKNISNRKFAEKISLSHIYFSNKSAMSSDILEKIYSVYPELNFDWVITGRGKMLIEDALTAEKKPQTSATIETLIADNSKLIETNKILSEANLIQSQTAKDTTELFKLSLNVQIKNSSTVGEDPALLTVAADPAIGYKKLDSKQKKNLITGNGKDLSKAGHS